MRNVSSLAVLCVLLRLALPQVASAAPAPFINDISGCYTYGDYPNTDFMVIAVLGRVRATYTAQLFDLGEPTESLTLSPVSLSLTQRNRADGSGPVTGFPTLSGTWTSNGRTLVFRGIIGTLTLVTSLSPLTRQPVDVTAAPRNIKARLEQTFTRLAGVTPTDVADCTDKVVRNFLNPMPAGGGAAISATDAALSEDLSFSVAPADSLAAPVE